MLPRIRFPRDHEMWENREEKEQYFVMRVDDTESCVHLGAKLTTADSISSTFDPLVVIIIHQMSLKINSWSFPLFNLQKSMHRHWDNDRVSRGQTRGRRELCCLTVDHVSLIMRRKGSFHVCHEWKSNYKLVQRKHNLLVLCLEQQKQVNHLLSRNCLLDSTADFPFKIPLC